VKVVETKKRVVIVKQGHWGDMQEGEYEALISLLERVVENKGVEVKLAPTFADAQDLLKKEEVSSLVFISRGMLPEARQIKDSYPKLRVVVFTGLVPAPGEYPFSLDGLVLVDKGKTWGGPAIREAILGK
jgi:hypothetical protein